MDDRPMSFTDHLAELRSRLLRSVAAIAVGFIAAWTFREEMFRLLARPVLSALRNNGIQSLQALQVTETVTVYLQVSLLFALFMAGPYILLQVWGFVAPGLLERERRWVVPAMALISSFFLLGVAFSYFVFLPIIVDFLIGFTMSSGDITLIPTVEKTFGLTATFLLVFGLVFEMPLLMFFLSLLGIVNHAKMLKFLRYFAVLSFVIGAIFTPPDPMSQSLMAVPLCALYLVGVAFAWAGGLLREGGRGRLPGIIGVSVFLFFATGVGTAAWLWDRSSAPSDHVFPVPGNAGFALRFDVRTPLGEGLLDRVGAPEKARSARNGDVLVVAMPEGMSWRYFGSDECLAGDADGPGGCLMDGPDVAAVDEVSDTFARIRDNTSPIALEVPARCLRMLAPRGPWRNSNLFATARETAEGGARLTMEFRGTSEALAYLLVEIRRIRDGFEPGQPPVSLGNTPIERLFSWSEGDFDLSDAPGSITLELAATRARLLRIIGEMTLAAARECAQ